ncbi:MAG: ribosomal protein S18-alanine N-acetyltransferase [Oscillospiraceae bacterium]|nr:ribosomal protein S18-alanine N-acetyltransferase [Oscillospiraceae bacterium]
MEIRHALPRDIAPIAALEAETFPLGADESALERMRKAPNSVILCAVDGDALLGYAYFQFVLDEGYVGDLAVCAEHRREGLGTALVNAMADEAREKALSFLTLEVRESNLPARRLYERCGFEIVGLRKNYYEKPAENAVLMTRTFI